MKYSQCKLFGSEHINSQDIDFTTIKELHDGGSPGAEHSDRYLVKCNECGLFYIKEVLEWWGKDGDDILRMNYFPVLEEEIDQVNALNWLQIMDHLPNIYYYEGSFRWKGREQQLNKDQPIRMLIKASRFATRVHQGQKRKGKEDPYIMHPLTVGVLLARTGANEDIIAAGILHDTIEDCHPYGSITKEILEKEFNADIARMVNDVTEQDKSLPWAERKQQALDHIPQIEHDSLLVKSADVLHNMCEQLADFQEIGEEMYKRFNAPKEDQLARYSNLIAALESAWEANPLLPDLAETLRELEK